MHCRCCTAPGPQRPKLKLGTRIHGFKITSQEEIPELEGTVHVMKHEKSGARLMYLETSDQNKAFAIGFKTPPADSTGVFHILEHSVLCGSEKFPVKEPFVTLLKSSMQTFLNAMTFPDKTLYPVASTNEKDLLNLMDVYLDAVLHPLIYQKKATFDQEGWHYELDDTSGELLYNGVVFNEMKGALSDSSSVLYDLLMESLFPDTTYRHESGGDPNKIPELSYEEFLDAHRRHYRLDNSYIVLYGDMGLLAQLELINSYYASIDQNSVGSPNPLVLQEPLIAPNVVREMTTSPENACLGLAYVAGTIHDRKRVIALGILLDALMGSNEAPLKRALLDTGLAGDFQAHLASGQLQPVVMIEARDSKGSNSEQLSKEVDRILTKLVEDGINPAQLEASLSRAEFDNRERDYGVADGVVLAMQALAGWLYDDSLSTAYLQYETAFAELREDIHEGYFEELLQNVFLDSTHRAQAEIKPAPAADITPEIERLRDIKKTLSEENLQELVKNTEELQYMQTQEDSPEALATLPSLLLSDVSGFTPDPAYYFDEHANLPCLRHTVPTRGINYSYHYFTLDTLNYEDLPYVGLLIRLLGKLDTEKHTAVELDQLIQSRLGALNFFTETYSNDANIEDLNPKLVVSASSLSENIADLVDIPREIWSSTDFSNTDKIFDIIQQNRLALEQDFINAGHSAALSRSASYYTPAAQISQQISGVDFYLFLKDLIPHYHDKKAEVVDRLKSICHKVFSTKGTVVSFTGNADDYEKYWEHSHNLLLSSFEDNDALKLPPLQKKGEAFIIPSDVSFASLGYDRRLLHIPYSGTWPMINRILSYDYLWNEIRVKGGAYGAGFKSGRTGGLQFYSYRDPNLDSTLQCFKDTAGWLSGIELDEEALRGYIISTLAGFDNPKKPREIARRQVADFFSHAKPNWLEKLRNEVLETTSEDLKNLSSVFDDLAEKNMACVFGSEKILSQSRSDLKVINLFNS